VRECPATEKRKLRFVGDAKAKEGAGLFVSCTEG